MTCSTFKGDNTMITIKIKLLKAFIKQIFISQRTIPYIEDDVAFLKLGLLIIFDAVYYLLSKSNFMRPFCSDNMRVTILTMIY